MPFISVNNRWHWYDTKADFLSPEFQKILHSAYHAPDYSAYCPCRGLNASRVDLEIFKREGKYFLRHVDHKPHSPDCPLYLVPGEGGSSNGIMSIGIDMFRDDESMSLDTFLNRSEAVRATFAAVARRTHDRLAWVSFLEKTNCVSWGAYVRALTTDFYNLESKNGPSVFECLSELGLVLVVGSLRNAGSLGKLSERSTGFIPLFLKVNPDGWSEGAIPLVRACTVRGALDYCRVYDHFVQGPYLFLGLVNSEYVITRCVLLPIFSRENRFCLVESHQERLLAEKLIGPGYHGWIKPADSGSWSDYSLPDEILQLKESAGNLPRMDFLARVEDKLVIIEHFGLNFPEYNLARRKKLQFAHRHLFPKGIYYWDSVYNPRHFKGRPDHPIPDFKIHEYRPDCSHGIFSLKEIDFSRYESSSI